MYIVRNNEEFAQTGIPTFFKQGEQGQTGLYGRMDKHTQPRITHRTPPPSPTCVSVLLCLCARLSVSVCVCLCLCAIARGCEARVCVCMYEAKPVILARPLARSLTNEASSPLPLALATIDHHPCSTSTISDMVANICRAKHTNTIQYGLLTASGAQPFGFTLKYQTRS